MSRYTQLKNAESFNDLAFLLGYKPKNLAYIIYAIPDEEKYHEFYIPKKNGGKRKILAPCDRLNHLQRRLANILSECVEEIRDNSLDAKKLRQESLRNVEKYAVSHAFKKDLSIASNAGIHIQQRYVLNIDLKDFFPSINFGRVRGYFLKSSKFRLSNKIATLIAQIACHNNELPQGGPCSPIISELIGSMLDMHMVKMAKKYKCKYTRYADDLTFSTSNRSFPRNIAYRKFFNTSKWQLNKKLVEGIEHSGFVVNPSKTHMQLRDSRQLVTGLVVNNVVNTKQEYYRNVRAMCHWLFTKGYYHIPNRYRDHEPRNSSLIVGILVKIKDLLGISHNDLRVHDDVCVISYELDKLEGLLSHIYYIKRYRNKYSRSGYRLSRHDGFRKSNGQIGGNGYPPFTRTMSHSDECHVVAIDGIRNLYSKFIYYKYFYACDKPLIVTEGKTDSVYIKCALKKFFATYTGLVRNAGTCYEYNVKFFNNSERTRDLLRMAEGASGLQYLVLGYEDHIKRYTSQGLQNPVIVVVDDDASGRAVVSAAISKYGVKRGGTIKLTHNLYLVVIPSTGGKDTVIENYFDKKVLDIELKGKTFQLDSKKFDKSKNYSKEYFASYVIVPGQNKINFDDFKPLLTEIDNIIKSY